jgi:hypothetical protein
MTDSGHLERKPTAVFRECHLFVSACRRRNLSVPAGQLSLQTRVFTVWGLKSIIAVSLNILLTVHLVVGLGK